MMQELSSVPGADPVSAVSEQLLALVDDLCAASPVVLAVDDLHWADAASVRLWHRLALSVRQLPLLLLATARSVPAREDVELVRRGLRSAGSPVLELGSLPAAAVGELVAELAGGRPGSRLAEMAANTGGNPLYVTELVASLARGGRGSRG